MPLPVRDFLRLLGFTHDPRYDDKHELTHYSQEEMEEEMLRLNDQIQQRLKESKALLRQLRKEADP